MSKQEKIRKPIKRARLKLWRYSARKASLHVASGGDTCKFSSAKWRQPPSLPFSPRIEPRYQFPSFRQTAGEGLQAIP